jgi:hypothetical protein
VDTSSKTEIPQNGKGTESTTGLRAILLDDEAGNRLDSNPIDQQKEGLQTGTKRRRPRSTTGIKKSSQKAKRRPIKEDRVFFHGESFLPSESEYTNMYEYLEYKRPWLVFSEFPDIINVCIEMDSRFDPSEGVESTIFSEVKTKLYEEIHRRNTKELIYAEDFDPDDGEDLLEEVKAAFPIPNNDWGSLKATYFICKIGTYLQRLKEWSLTNHPLTARHSKDKTSLLHYQIKLETLKK